MLSRVFEFNQKVLGLTRDQGPASLERNEHYWLSHVLREEAMEFETSGRGELDEMVDALVDSIVFAMGGLYRLGLSEEQALACFHAVMDANFEKKAGQKAGRVFGAVVDAVKPHDWVGPEARIRKVLG